MWTVSRLVQHRRVIRSNQLHLIPPDGSIPSEKDRLLYKWQIQFGNDTTTEYTSVPQLQTGALLTPGILTMHVSVSNKGK
ncbi:hypothetical protein AVEN_71622-1 [Araneus ventricosus]|uniref:Uncharacterized protein n=1 Tax=Araneus ventricosus TaxID=182803 RepID=A0A4Y2GDP9_ARAVE|nr:hypothetical protein AVEN_71622-1 [Araneus ventricosus]